MEMNDNIFNAAEIGENPATEFIAEGKRLHAVEARVAHEQKDKSDPKIVLPLIREALIALIQYAQGKVESHFLDVDLKQFDGKPDEEVQLRGKIEHIFSHLHHHDRNELSSLIHHRKSNSSPR
jgi:hypothetical protein